MGMPYLCLRLGELEHEVFGEAFPVSLDCLIQRLRLYLVEFGQVTIEHDLLALHEVYLVGDVLVRDHVSIFLCFHVAMLKAQQETQKARGRGHSDTLSIALKALSSGSGDHFKRNLV